MAGLRKNLPDKGRPEEILPAAAESGDDTFQMAAATAPGNHPGKMLDAHLEDLRSGRALETHA